MSDDFDPLGDLLDSNFLKEGADWNAVFNPRVPRQMDVNLAKIFVHEKVVCSLRFSADAKLLAVGSDGSVVVYDLVSEQKTTFILDSVNDKNMNTGPEKRNYARSVSISLDGQYLGAGSEDKLVRVWSLLGGTLLHTFRAHRGEVYAVDFSPDGRSIVSASGDGTIRIWDMASARRRILYPADDLNKSKVAFACVAISQDSRLVAGGSLDGTIRVWDIGYAVTEMEDTDEGEGGIMVERLRGHRDSVYSVKFVEGLGSARGLLSGSLDKTLKRWELGSFDDDNEGSDFIVKGREDGTGERGSFCVKTLKGHQDVVLATSTVREGFNCRAASASRDGSVRLWDLKTGMTLFVVRGHKNTVTSIDLSPDGRLIASGSGDCTVRICGLTHRLYHSVLIFAP